MNFLKGEFHKCCGNSCDFPSAKWPEVVFAGRSNVGKSSIINRIFNMKHIAKTSSSPGKTATINFYAAGNGFLVDLPGYGYAKTSKNEKQKWANLIETYYASNRSICLTVIVIDCRRGISDYDRIMADFLIKKRIKFIFVLNKADKLTKSYSKNIYETVKLEFEAIKVILLSVKKMEGIEALKQAILKAVNEN